jgi:hypothetical protein
MKFAYEKPLEIEAFIDSNFAGNREGRKNVTGITSKVCIYRFHGNQRVNQNIS